LKILNVSDSLKIIESNPTIGGVIPKLKIRKIEINLMIGLCIIENTAKDNTIQLSRLKIVWKSTIAE